MAKITHIDTGDTFRDVFQEGVRHRMKQLIQAKAKEFLEQLQKDIDSFAQQAAKDVGIEVIKRYNEMEPGYAYQVSVSVLDKNKEPPK